MALASALPMNGGEPMSETKHCAQHAAPDTADSLPHGAGAGDSSCCDAGNCHCGCVPAAVSIFPRAARITRVEVVLEISAYSPVGAAPPDRPLRPPI